MKGQVANLGNNCLMEIENESRGIVTTKFGHHLLPSCLMCWPLELHPGMFFPGLGLFCIFIDGLV